MITFVAGEGGSVGGKKTKKKNWRVGKLKGTGLSVIVSPVIATDRRALSRAERIVTRPTNTHLDSALRMSHADTVKRVSCRLT